MSLISLQLADIPPAYMLSLLQAATHTAVQQLLYLQLLGAIIFSPATVESS